MEHSACGGCRSNGWGRGHALAAHTRLHKTISKILSGILRHRAVTLNIKIRSDGYCALDDVLATKDLKDLQVTHDDVLSVVWYNNKQRFDVTDENGATFIRAANGHSLKEVKDSDLFQPLSLADRHLPHTCVHGTKFKYLDSILKSGLFAVRNHIHFSPFEPGDGRIISGMHDHCDLAIWVDLRKALRDGIRFYLSTNQVLLSPGRHGQIPSQYFTKVRNLRSGEDVPLLECSQRRGHQEEQSGSSLAPQGRAPFKSPPTHVPPSLTLSLTSPRIAAGPGPSGSSLAPQGRALFKSPPTKVPPSLASPPTSPGGGHGSESPESRAAAAALPAATADAETKAEFKGPAQQPRFVSFEDQTAGSGDGAAGREPSTDSSSSGWLGEEDPEFSPPNMKPGDRCKEPCHQPKWLAREFWCRHRCSLTRRHTGPHACVDHARTSPAYWDVDDLPADAPEFVPSNTVRAGRTVADVSPWDRLLTEYHQTGLNEMD